MTALAAAIRWGDIEQLEELAFFWGSHHQFMGHIGREKARGLSGAAVQSHGVSVWDWWRVKTGENMNFSGQKGSKNRENTKWDNTHPCRSRFFSQRIVTENTLCQRISGMYGICIRTLYTYGLKATRDTRLGDGHDQSRPNSKALFWSQQ